VFVIESIFVTPAVAVSICTFVDHY